MGRIDFSVIERKIKKQFWWWTPLIYCDSRFFLFSPFEKHFFREYSTFFSFLEKIFKNVGYVIGKICR